MIKEWMKVIETKPIARDIYKMKLAGELVTHINSPGQFVHIQCGGMDTLLRRPISICDVDETNHQITILFRVEGKGTRKLAEKRPGEKLDVLGPLGSGFPTDNPVAGDKVLVTGGGIGVPPLYHLAKTLKSNGVQVTSVLGFSDHEAVFYEEEFSQIGPNAVATMDGSYGVHGTVTDVIEKKGIEFDWIYACGPVPMLKALETQHPHAKGFLSLEERMGCGIGACFACVCRPTESKSETSYMKVCTDGPVFKWKEVAL